MVKRGDRPGLWSAYRMRLKRRRLLWRSFRSRHQLTALADRTDRIRRHDILLVGTLCNEALRLPHFLAHYRNLGVDHFLFVDNDSTDGTADLLRDQQDVSVWHTAASYRDARFGLDWVTWLQMHHAHGHWTVMADADELLIYADHERCDLHGLTHWLDGQGRSVFGAHMLDLFPRGPLGSQAYDPGQDPLDVLNWFEAGPWRVQRQNPMGNLWVQGGIRERIFFAERPERSPTLNKLPLVRWNRRLCYVNSCHAILPPKLNWQYNGPESKDPAGVLLHTKFLPDIVSRSALERSRGQHFRHPEEMDHYYDRIAERPDLWTDAAHRYSGCAQLQDLGLMSPALWSRGGSEQG